ncbi:MAG TPA: ATPase domain-containing protein [Vicinamibacterales bacterium]|jgi:circadian clock protein KaiC|nr:ATPase domain-containing protein [Vicinamibacterales bacterium]
MSEAAAPERALVGIPGLDHLLQGGFPAQRLHLVEGDPGTGKTTLALQFLLSGRQRDERTLYVTLSETSRELVAVAKSHGWNLDGIDLFELTPTGGRTDDQYTLYHPAEIELTEMVKRILDVTEQVNPSRVVLDSLSEMRLLARDPLRYRRQVLALKEYFAGRHCTVLMLDDRTSATNDLQLQSIAHSVIRLEQLASEFGRSRRRLRIVKVRGVAATEGYHDFKIRHGGIEVYPQLVPAATRSFSSEQLPSGVAAMDALVGGGLTPGTCTLFIGPAGVGKSSFAAQYLTASANKVPCAIYLFDERRSTLLHRSDTLGMNMTAAVKSGSITIDQIEPGELSPGEFAHRICHRVDTDGARVVLIDSLNGYLHAIPTAHSPLVRMHELLAYLNERGVATLLVAAQHGIIGNAMSAPIDLSYLADTVILFRFFEANGQVRKAVSVMKKRTGGHETSIREFDVSAQGLRVGNPLTAFQGVMTGVPQYRGDVTPLLQDRATERP